MKCRNPETGSLCVLFWDEKCILDVKPELTEQIKRPVWCPEDPKGKTGT